MQSTRIKDLFLYTFSLAKFHNFLLNHVTFNFLRMIVASIGSRIARYF